MLSNSYFYNATIRKTVAIFGSIFNNIVIGKLINDTLSNVIRVPLAYGPRERFLARIRDSDNSGNSDIAIKLPRMSFEITSLTYDTTSKLNRLNQRQYNTSNNAKKIVLTQSTPYMLGIQLNIISRDLDSGLQILEQILPTFEPEYTVSVKGMEGPDSRTDVPIILQGVSWQDDYEGDFESGRRTIIYTLDFIIKIKFAADFNKNANIIKEVTVNIIDGTPCISIDPIDLINVKLGDMENDTPQNFTIKTNYGFN